MGKGNFFLINGSVAAQGRLPKGGGALLQKAQVATDQSSWRTDDLGRNECPLDLPWHVFWTHSHCESLVLDQLTARGFEAFLPMIDVWRRWNRVRRVSRVPMFPGYLFLHHAMDKASFIEMSKMSGIVRILGERWDRLAEVPGKEIEAIRAVMQASLPALPYPYLQEGQRVRITSGPLANVEGILVQFKPTKGLLILSIDFLRRSMAVEVDCTLAAPA
ncbi:MAG: hypothetical protein O7B35_13700 [Deltaproteobacteria bacterium]|nr:hypothetical protein [Deltaproteobacteria bacterium]